MHFQKQTHYFIPFCLILLMFFAFENFVLTNATRLPSLNWSKNAEKTAFLSAYNNTSSIEMKSFKRENTILQQMVEKEESLIEDTVDFINGTNAAPIFWWAPYSSSDGSNWEQLAADPTVIGKADVGQTDLGASDQQVRPKRTIGNRRKRARTNKHEIRKCSMHTFEKCLVMMQEVMQNSSLAFPTNVDDLETTCKKLKAGDYCAEKYIRSCAGDQQRLLYQDIVQGTKNVIRLICQQGETQQLYLEFASCFKDIFVSEVKCSKVLTRFQDISKFLSAGPSPATGNEPSVIVRIAIEERLKQFCCAYRDVVDCQLKNVRKFCGVKGLEFFERYMGEMTNSLINEHCIGYTFHDKCRPYQQDLAEIFAEKDTKFAVASDQGRNSSSGKSNRIKSKLVHNSSNSQASGSVSLYSASPLHQHITCLVFVKQLIAVGSHGKILAGFAISGSIFWIFIKLHYF